MNSKLSTGEQASAGPSPSTFLCAARHSDTGANDPQDCNWPFCGCDPYADKVIAAIQESGFTLVKDTDLLRDLKRAEGQSPEAPERAAAPPEPAEQDANDPATETRWQDAIYELCKKSVGSENDHLIDGGGSDSGDALDFTLAEIGQAIGFWRNLVEESIGGESPAPATPKVLTGADIERLATGNHACKPDTCGCHCGVTYNKNWEWIIASHDGTHTRPKCKCIPAERAAGPPEPAQMSAAYFWVSDLWSEDQPSHAPGIVEALGGEVSK